MRVERGTARLGTLVSFLGLLTGHGQINVDLVMNSLIASCAEQNGGDTDV